MRIKGDVKCPSIKWMLLSFSLSEIHGLCDIYFKIHSSWKKIQESPPLWRFSIDLYSFGISASIALNSCYYYNRHSTYIVPSSHVYVCHLGRAVKFSRVLARSWKLLNIQWMNKFLFGFFLFLISLNKVTRWGSFHPYIIHACLHITNVYWTSGECHSKN